MSVISNFERWWVERQNVSGYEERFETDEMR
jgi:hypothetical protein